jgi:membrane protease YdiL (CAAX protease family)
MEALPYRCPISPTPDPAEHRAWLCAAAVITFAYPWLAEEIAARTWPLLPRAWQSAVGERDWYGVGELAYGLLLALPTWRACGLRLGNIGRHWRGVLFVCGLPVALTALIYPRLPERPFAGGGDAFWLLSAPAQELVFTGFLYGRFERLFPALIHPRLPVRQALLVTAAFFAAWHLRNFEDVSAGFVLFQLTYTFLGFVWVGLARQWTGSVLPGMATHMVINYLASRPG